MVLGREILVFLGGKSMLAYCRRTIHSVGAQGPLHGCDQPVSAMGVSTNCATHRGRGVVLKALKPIGPAAEAAGRVGGTTSGLWCVLRKLWAGLVKDFGQGQLLFAVIPLADALRSRCL